MTKFSQFESVKQEVDFFLVKHLLLANKSLTNNKIDARLNVESTQA